MMNNEQEIGSHVLSYNFISHNLISSNMQYFDFQFNILINSFEIKSSNEIGLSCSLLVIFNVMYEILILLI